MATVEKACTTGIPDENLHFGLPDEPTGAKVGVCLREFETIVIHCGMDPVFNVIQKDGPTINMLKEPGKLTRTKVETWINDLTTLGVWDPINQQRLPVCPHDEQNLVWSADAFEASWTPNAKRSIRFEIKDSEINGPLALFVYLFKVQRPSRAKVDTMAETVKALKLTSFPGENVSLFMQTIIPMLEDIEMCAMTFSQVPNSASLALKGLMAATDPMISIQANTMHCEVDGDGAEDSDVSTLPKAKAAMSKIEDTYRSLATTGHYGPAIPIRPAHQANLAGTPSH